MTRQKGLGLPKDETKKKKLEEEIKEEFEKLPGLLESGWDFESYKKSM